MFIGIEGLPILEIFAFLIPIVLIFGIDDMAIATIGATLLPLLFGGKKEQKQVTETEIPPAGFQDPMLPVMSPAILQMLLKNLSAWGGPAGPKGTTGTFYSPGMMGDIMSLIGGEWPTLMAGARGQPPPRGKEAPRLPRRLGRGL